MNLASPAAGDLLEERMTEGALHPRTLWDVMVRPIPEGGQYNRTETGGFQSRVNVYPADRKTMGLAELDLIARVALWGLPVMFVAGAGLGYWLGKRK